MSSPKPVMVSEVFAAAAKKIEQEQKARDCYIVFCAESKQFGLAWEELLEDHRKGWRAVVHYLELDK